MTRGESLWRIEDRMWSGLAGKSGQTDVSPSLFGSGISVQIDSEIV